MSFKPITVNTPATDPAHILAQDDAILYHGIIGQDCVLDIGSKMEAVIIDNNTVRILDGAVMVQGHLGHIPNGEYEDLHIENGVAGQKRHDLIVARFETTAGIDTYDLAVIKGVSDTNGVDPDITVGNLSAGDMLREYPLYRVKIDGLSLASVEKVHTIGSTIGILHQSLNSHISESSKMHITESGSNVNGRYIKFDDGTAICWHLLNVEYADSATLLKTWYFPILMPGSIPRVFPVKRNVLTLEKRRGSCYSSTPDETGVVVGIAAADPVFDSSTTHAVHVLAIGRWKV